MRNHKDLPQTTNTDEHVLSQKISGSLLGLMVGDALALPYEGMSARRISKLLAKRPGHRLLFRKGMVSDDTEHAVMTASAMIKHWGHWAQFQGSLAWRLRWWLLRLPAGVGMATGRAIIKLWLCFPPRYNGVYSAGNGPAMRAPIIGIALGDQPDTMKSVIKQSTELTHTDPKATIAALSIAHAAYLASNGELVEFKTFRASLDTLLADQDAAATKEFLGLMDSVEECLHKSDADFVRALSLEKGVTGYCYHTVPTVLYIWQKYQLDFEGAMTAMICLGGDTDTTCAILGGIIGAQVRKASIPEDWIDNILDWPFNPAYIESVAAQLANSKLTNQRSLPRILPGPLILIRNLVFLVVVLAHGFRRLLPPY